MSKKKKTKNEEARELPVMNPDKSADPPQPQGRKLSGNKNKS